MTKIGGREWKCFNDLIEGRQDGQMRCRLIKIVAALASWSVDW